MSKIAQPTRVQSGGYDVKLTEQTLWKLYDTGSHPYIVEHQGEDGKWFYSNMRTWKEQQAQIAHLREHGYDKVEAWKNPPGNNKEATFIDGITYQLGNILYQLKNLFK
jgi:hypothetical protein